MASALNMDEGSDTATHTDSVEEGESDRGGASEGGRERGEDGEKAGDTQECRSIK